MEQPGRELGWVDLLLTPEGFAKGFISGGLKSALLKGTGRGAEMNSVQSCTAGDVHRGLSFCGAHRHGGVLACWCLAIWLPLLTRPTPLVPSPPQVRVAVSTPSRSPPANFELSQHSSTHCAPIPSVSHNNLELGKADGPSQPDSLLPMLLSVFSPAGQTKFSLMSANFSQANFGLPYRLPVSMCHEVSGLCHRRTFVSLSGRECLSSWAPLTSELQTFLSPVGA